MIMGLVELVTVLVTGCGGAVGQCIVSALLDAIDSLRVIGCETDPYAAPFYLLNSGMSKVYHTSYGDSQGYIPELINLCRIENVDIVFPGTDVELPKLAASKKIFADNGVKVIVSPYETVEICRDKWLSYKHLSSKVPFVRSATGEDDLEGALNLTGIPAVLKPRVGWGSKQVYKVESVAETEILMKHFSKPLLQTWLEGEEYTVDCLADKKGKLVCAVPRLRLKIFSGLSFEGITVKNPKLIALGARITKELRFYGPFNFQAKFVNGEPVVFEINPRFSGGGILTVRSGANLPLLSVREACGNPLPDVVDFCEGIVFSRYFKEVVFTRAEVDVADD
jgi:carbamoyl-phosphate synthase large subunit